jgi:hypothetical protein
MHRSPSTQLRTLSSRDMPLPPVSVALHYLSRFGPTAPRTNISCLGKSWREDGEKVPHLLQGSARDGNPGRFGPTLRLTTSREER